MAQDVIVKIEYSKAEKLMASLLVGNGGQTLKQEQLDTVQAQLKAAKDFETLSEFQALYSGNLSAYNKALEQHGLVNVERAKPASIVRLETAKADILSELAKLQSKK